MNIVILLFNEFETLDVFGPVEIFGRLPQYYNLRYHSLQGGMISNHHGVHLQTEGLDFIPDKIDILLIPGGRGVRKEVHDKHFIDNLIALIRKSNYVLSICTGSALLAQTGYLNNKHATSNKLALPWVSSLNQKVHWNKRARWVADGNYYTSSGVSAGIDMCLGFVAEQHGYQVAIQVAKEIEYHWIEDRLNDTFALSD